MVNLRATIIHIASELPKGNETRRKLLRLATRPLRELQPLLKPPPPDHKGKWLVREHDIGKLNSTLSRLGYTQETRGSGYNIYWWWLPPGITNAGWKPPAGTIVSTPFSNTPGNQPLDLLVSFI